MTNLPPVRQRAHSLLLAAGLLGVAACTPIASTDPEVLRVAAAFYPLEYVAERVGDDHVEVVGLTPPGVEPHDVELTASQMAAGTGADLLVYIGDGFQPAVDDLLGSARGVKVDALAGEELLEAFGGHDHGDESDHETEQHTDGKRLDPHIWLDPTRLATVAHSLAASLSDLKPQAAGTFESNAEALSAELAALDREFSKGLADCRSRAIVTSHEAFAYLADRYDLKQIGIGGLSPEAEPSPGKLAEATSFVIEHGINTIFFQELVSPAIADTVALETGSSTSVLSPLEIGPESGDYFTVMRRNLQNLRAALECN